MEKPDIAFIPTPTDALDAMLLWADPKPSDCLYDLGCGDGRFVVESARRFGNRAVGIDVDGNCLTLGRSRAQDAGVAHLTTFRQENLYGADFSEATIVILYLLPHLNVKLRPRLWQQLQPGTRIISHQFDMGDWVPDQKQVLLNSEEESTLYQWIVQAHHKRPAP
ncbi:MAG: class I SAM-dependent methyltransferase [Cyanothece sp. SIO2G6]|nr:class I SAM-dependent methyltransferase [Cyanothece sp. SIO2G6]